MAAQVVYAGLEPLVHKYVKDLRTPEGVSGGVLAQMQHVLVFLRVVTAEQAQASRGHVHDEALHHNENLPSLRAVYEVYFFVDQHKARA